MNDSAKRSSTGRGEEQALRLDPKTFEILRHRLWYINDEGALHEHKAFTEVPVFAGEKLRPGHRIEGPALVEAEDMAVLVRGNHRLWVDAYQNLRIDLRDPAQLREGEGVESPAASASSSAAGVSLNAVPTHS